MTDDKAGKAKGYGSTVNTELESIALAKLFLARHDQVVPHLNENDKTPNTDGRVDLKDDSGIPIGSLEVQVKTLGKKHKCKYSCDVGFLYYCDEIAQNPVLFFGVDREEEKVYWLLMDSSLLTSLNYKENKSDKTLTLKEEQYFDRDKKDYKDEWLQVVQRHKLILKNYVKLEEELERLKIENDKMSQENKNKPLLDTVMNEANINFVNIHKFLDNLNDYLDNEFNVIKRTLYKNCWKLGFAYLDYTSHYATYFIYPIAKDRNDVQIKKIDKTEKDALLHKGITLRGCGNPNAIDSRPDAHAKSLLKRDMEKIFKFGLLDYRNDFLANEFVVAFVDKLRVPLGLEKKDSYTLEEIKFGFYNYLLVWVSETISFINNHTDKKRVEITNRLINENRYIDPCMLEDRLSSGEKNIIAETVKKRLQETSGKSFNSWSSLWNEEYSFVVFADFLNYLSGKNVENVNRIYKEYRIKDEKNDEPGKEYLCGYYDGFDEFAYNAKEYFERLENTYNSIVKQNFPMLEKELSLYQADVDRVVITLRYKKVDDDVTSRMLGISGQVQPLTEIYLLSSFLKNDNGKRLNFFGLEEGKEFDDLDLYQNLKAWEKIGFEGKEYRVVIAGHSVWHVNDIKGKAMFDYINKKLREKIEKILSDSEIRVIRFNEIKNK